VKRVLDCVRILAEVRKTVDARLLMVGDGPERGPAQHLAAQLGVSGSVEFVGKQNHVERLIRRAHVLLMPSEMESFGLAALEAMACGVVPVGTDCGRGAGIDHGWSGWLFGIGRGYRSTGCANSRIADERGASREDGCRGAEDCRETVSTESLIPRYERYYEEVLARG